MKHLEGKLSFRDIYYDIPISLLDEIIQVHEDHEKALAERIASATKT